MNKTNLLTKCNCHIRSELMEVGGKQLWAVANRDRLYQAVAGADRGWHAMAAMTGGGRRSQSVAGGRNRWKAVAMALSWPAALSTPRRTRAHSTGANNNCWTHWNDESHPRLFGTCKKSLLDFNWVSKIKSGLGYIVYNEAKRHVYLNVGYTYICIVSALVFLASGEERRAAKRRVDRRRELPVTVIPVNRTTS